MDTAYVYSEKPVLAAQLVGLAKSFEVKEVLAIAFDDESSAALSNCGADGIIELSGDSAMPENNARSLASWLSDAFAVDPGLLIVGATSIGRDLSARVAGYLDCGFSGDIISAELAEDDAISTTRSEYGGAVVLAETLPLPAVITVPAGRFDAASGAASIIDKGTLEPDTRIEVTGTTPIVKEGIDLSRAKAIVGVGMGFSAREDIALAEDLAAVIDAGIGCTRGIAEERHWLSTEQYLGLSGLTVAPDLYVAVGMSGQVQHLAGVRDSKVIVAINKNEEAPIFKAADYGIVGDLYEVLPALTAALK